MRRNWSYFTGSHTRLARTFFGFFLPQWRAVRICHTVSIRRGHLGGLLYTAIAANKRYSVLLFVLFSVIAVGVSVWMSVVASSPWPAVIILGFTGAYTWWQFRSAVGIVAKLAGCIEVAPGEQPELYRVVQNLAIRNGMPMPKVCVINDAAANAIAVGMGPSDAVIAVTRGTLDLLTRSELEGVVAHELAHIKNLDSRVKLTIFSLVGAFRSEEHTSELQSRPHLVCRLLLEKKKKNARHPHARSQPKQCPSPECM